MELAKIDLSAIAAIGHDHDHDQLGLLINTGENQTYVEIPAPIYAYEGLQELADIVEYYYDDDYEPIVEEYHPTMPPLPELGSREYYEISQEIEFKEYDGDLYRYEKKVEVKITESLSLVETANEQVYLSGIQYDPEGQNLRMEFEDGTVYQYDEVTPEFWLEFQNKIT